MSMQENVEEMPPLFAGLQKVKARRAHHGVDQRYLCAPSTVSRVHRPALT